MVSGLVLSLFVLIFFANFFEKILVVENRKEPRNCLSEHLFSSAHDCHWQSFCEVCFHQYFADFYQVGGCRKRNNCKYLHICRSFLVASCQGCALQHTLAPKDVSLLQSLGIDCLHERIFEFLRTFCLADQNGGGPMRIPKPCKFYNWRKCTMPRCRFIHICQTFLDPNSGECQEVDYCNRGLSHVFVQKELIKL